MRRALTFCFCTIGLVVVLLQTADMSAVLGTFALTGSMATPRLSHAAVLLPDGNVLVAGNERFSRSAEIYDPSTAQFSRTGDLNIGRCYGCGAVLLSNGKVLLAGGWAGGSVLKSAELYNPSTRTFSLTAGSMAVARLGPKTVLLRDGRVLIVMGHTGNAAIGSAEIYDPATESFSPTGSMVEARLGTATLLNNGAVLVVGGMSTSQNAIFLASAEIYDPVAGSFARTGGMAVGRHGHQAVLLNDGRVLITGGSSPTYYNQHVEASAEIYDPAAGTFSVTGSMSTARTGHRMVVLRDGRALVIGGSDSAGKELATTEIFSPSDQTFTPGPAMVVRRSNPEVTTLTDGRLLVSGGYLSGNFLASAEIYEDPIDTTPPVVANVPTSIQTEATSSTGALMAWETPTASDDRDGSVPVVCVPASGSMFRLGATPVTCTATDAAGNSSSAIFTVTIIDTTPPVIASHADMTLEATQVGGAVVAYQAPTASDIVDGAVPVVCQPAASTLFGLGVTTVVCDATDAHGNIAGTRFFVTVQDTTPPVLLDVPPDALVEATGPNGAWATWVAPTATDLADGPVPVICSSASGSVYPIGVTNVTCTATDASGNQASGAFTITVRDTTPPVVPAPMATPGVLWPPNHQMAAVTLRVAPRDLVDATPVCRVTKITSNEPENGLGDGDIAPDWTINGPLAVMLRAERAGTGRGRTYTLTVACSDASGNTALATSTVSVPKSQAR